MDYERTPKGITYRGIRRAFADEANSNSDFVSRIDKALGGGFIGVSHGAFMKNQGTDLHLQVHQPDGADGRVALIVHIDQFLDQGIIDLEAKPKVKKFRDGEFRRVTIAPKIWFHHTGNAANAENRLTFEKLLKIASPDFTMILEEGINRAQRTFHQVMKPKSSIPWFMMTK
ncbi:hypothetical protein QE419_000073 [Brevundimonas vesicularis]|uniref:hypothetical protein n=1 Tax=Brevundimonas vesicularis TaxID=41276 RepID=UPI002781D4AF|nr:hypothetical protein [Brevundimonas vesicularis]MDQ1191307.1 hypothetical protein [Brevundimonas vesicularis]